MLRIAVFDTHKFDREALEAANQSGLVAFHFVKARLSAATVALATGCQAVCIFVNDRADGPVLEALAALGIRMIALRCAGFNNVDIGAARRLGLGVARVPEYSPYAIAEHAVGLILALNRRLVRAASRIREGNFSLEGLVGFDLHGKTVGIVGTGRIGATFAKIMHGFGCVLLASDPVPNPSLEGDLGVRYCALDELFSLSDIISLHLPLTATSRHLVDTAAVARMRRGVMLINTGRGALVDTLALTDGLKSGQIGAAGLDVYEEEEGVFFEDHSGEVLDDEKLSWLLMCPNVLVTAHQAFLTREALQGLAAVTVKHLEEFAAFAESAADVGGAQTGWMVLPKPSGHAPR